MGLFGALHSTALSGSSIQFLVIFSLPGIKEGFELVDREFATKVALKDGRKSKLAVAWKVEVLAVIDARGTGEKPCSNGIRDVQPKSLSPDGAILGNVIRQGEEVRVGEKCCGFALVVEGVSVTHRPFEGMCAAWAIPSRNCGKTAGSAISCGRWQREFESPGNTIFT